MIFKRVLGQFLPGKLLPGQLPPDNFHLGELYCLRIVTPGQLMPRAMAVTNYSFFMAIFYFFSMVQLYNFYFLL